MESPPAEIKSPCELDEADNIETSANYKPTIKRQPGKV